VALPSVTVADLRKLLEGQDDEKLGAFLNAFARGAVIEWLMQGMGSDDERAGCLFALALSYPEAFQRVLAKLDEMNPFPGFAEKGDAS